jgi:hypothetical protein
MSSKWLAAQLFKNEAKVIRQSTNDVQSLIKISKVLDVNLIKLFGE